MRTAFSCNNIQFLGSGKTFPFQYICKSFISWLTKPYLSTLIQYFITLDATIIVDRSAMCVIYFCVSFQMLQEINIVLMKQDFVIIITFLNINININFLRWVIMCNYVLYVFIQKILTQASQQHSNIVQVHLLGSLYLYHKIPTQIVWN